MTRAEIFLGRLVFDRLLVEVAIHRGVFPTPGFPNG
jgi:hypothetical protein